METRVLPWPGICLVCLESFASQDVQKEALEPNLNACIYTHIKRSVDLSLNLNIRVCIFLIIKVVVFVENLESKENDKERGT